MIEKVSSLVIMQLLEIFTNLSNYLTQFPDNIYSATFLTEQSGEYKALELCRVLGCFLPLNYNNPSAHFLTEQSVEYKALALCPVPTSFLPKGEEVVREADTRQ